MLNLTPQERQVILFLATVALLGMGIDFLKKNCSRSKVISNLDHNIGRINLNNADQGLLMSIPGIGLKLSQKIIEYRNKNGDFKDREELKNIKGITSYKYEKIKDNLDIR